MVKDQLFRVEPPVFYGDLAAFGAAQHFRETSAIFAA
jgi:hypothetical protein